MALKQNSPIWQYFDNIVELGMAECKLCKQRLRNNRSFNLKQHLRNVHRDNTEVWRYFDNYLAEGVAVCKTCNKRMQNRTCNMKLHLRRTHNIEVTPAKNKRAELPYPFLQKSYNEERIQAVLKKAKCNMGKTKNKSEKQSIILVKMDKNTLIRSVLGFVVEDCMSLSAIGSKNMKSILQPLCSAISADEHKEFNINEEEIERLLGVVSNLMRNEFSNELHWRLLSLKIETDINASPNSFCLSVMFVDKSQIQNRVLGIIDLENGAQLTEDHIKDMLHKFNIDSNQIISAYWDNTKGNHHKFVSNTEYLNEIQNYEEYPDLQLGDIKVEHFVGTIAHQCVLDVLKNPSIFKLFLECRNLVKFLSDQTNGYYELFEKNNLTIPLLDSPWQWGSTHQMIQNLHDASSILENIKYEKPSDPDDYFNMNSNMWSFIEAFCKTLNIIQKSILKFYGEELNFGDFYAQWLKCKLITEKFLLAETNTDSYSYMILTELTKCIEKRSHQVLSQDCFVACLYLDPRFQRTLNLSQKSIALEYLKRLWSLARLYNFEIVDKEYENVENITTDKLMDEDEDAFLNEYLSQDIQIKDTNTADVYRKIEGLNLSFQTVETNILLFWKAQQKSEPEIHTLSSICFAIPATQNYFKKIYSDFYKLEHDENLSHFTKENLLYMRLNSEHLTNAVEHLDLCKDDILSENASCESEREDVIMIDDDSNTASTSTAHFTGSVIASKTAIVHPMQAAETPVDVSSANCVIKN